MDNLNKLFDDIDTLERQLKKKYPAQKGRVLLANIKTEVDYELGKPTSDAESIKWSIEYKNKLKKEI